MKPTQAQLHPVNELMTNMLLAYFQAESRFAANRAAPVVPVADESGTYITFDKKYWFADQMARRAYGDTYARGGYALDKDTYETIQWGLEHPIPDEHRATSQVPMELEQIAVRWLGQQSLLRKEKAFADAFMIGGLWGTTNSAATDWDSTGKPITDILTAQMTVSQATGYTPNAIVMGEIVYNAIISNAEVVGAIQYTNSVTMDTRERLLGQVLGLEQVYVSRAVLNTANLGQTAVIAPIIDDDALVFYNNPGAGIFDATALKTFAWAPGGGLGSIRTYREEKANADIVQHKEQWDQKLIASDLGYIFTDIV